ncbi:MAG: amidohydrolase family protein [Xanthobacteraceae bacterium]
MIIDIFNHFMPPRYFERVRGLAPDHAAATAFPRLKTLWDVEARLRLMDQFGDFQQVLSLANPPLELLAPPAQTPDLARMANDGLAELCRAYPQRFPTFIASLPMNNIEQSLREIDRAVGDLGAKGIQIFTNVAGKPLSAVEFRPIFALMAQHGLPVWVHPMRGPQFSDYAAEQASENEVWFTFGWPYETTAAMTRLIYSGLLDELPDLAIITHHMGGMIPYFAGRIGLGFQQIFFGAPNRNPAAEKLEREPGDYFKMLYADTALNGEAGATRCGHAYFGTPRCLFATDAPFDAEQGRGLIAKTIAAVNALEIGKAEREQIFCGNARALLKLPSR